MGGGSEDGAPADKGAGVGAGSEGDQGEAGVAVAVSMTVIGGSAFEGCTSLIHKAPKGSFALDCGKKTKIKYVKE